MQRQHPYYFFRPALWLIALLAVCPAGLAAARYSVTVTTANWIDPSGHTLVTWSGGTGCSGGSYNGFSPDDDITAQIPLGFTFTFGSTDYTSVQIMSNGRVQFNNGWCDFGTPYFQVPDGNLDNTLYALSMDLNPSLFDNSAGGGNSTTTCDPNDATQPCGVYYASLGTAPNRHFVITWRNVPEYGDSRRFFNVQAIIYEDGHFELQYDVNGRDPLNGTPGVGWQLDTATNFAYNYNDVDDLTGIKLVFTVTDLAALLISAPPFANRCFPVPIGITALDSNGDVYTAYTGTISVGAYDDPNPAPGDLQGTWSNGDGAGIFNSGGAGSGTAVYQFVVADGGTIILNFDNSNNQDITIVVTDNGTGIQAVYSEITYYRATFELVPAGAVTPANTVVAGRPHNFTVTSYERSGGTCVVETGYVGPKDLQAWITRVTADPVGAAPSIGASGPLPDSNPGFGNAENIVLNFTAGVATLTLDSSDVGKYGLSLNDTDEANGHIGASPTMTVRPFGYAFSAPAFNAGATGAVAGIASTPFTFGVSGVLWEAVDDADNDGVPDGHGNTNPADDAALGNNGVTPSFAWDTSLQAVQPITPAAGVVGVLGVGAVDLSSFTGGSATEANQTYSEVGGVTVQATGTDYLGSSGVNITSRSPIIGRFTPAYLDVVITRQGCFVPGFTYSGQPVDEVQITARNAAGATTQNYGPAFSRAITFSDGGATGTGTFSNNTVAAGSFTGGTVTLADQPTFTFTAPETLPTSIPLRATDSDAVNSSGHEQSIAVRSGRARLLSTGGSELLPLPMAFRIETWRDLSGTPGWQIETGDTCTVLNTGNVAFSNLNPGSLNITATALSLAAGVGSITLTGDQTGSADITLNVSAWLEFDWNSDATLDDPSARAAFGVYNGNDAQIYIRE